MSITTNTGAILSAEVLDRMAENWESDTWEGSLSNITVGRPKISHEELVTLTVKVPRSRVLAIEELVKRTGKSKSQIVRDSIDRALANVG